MVIGVGGKGRFLQLFNCFPTKGSRGRESWGPYLFPRIHISRDVLGLPLKALQCGSASTFDNSQTLFVLICIELLFS